MKRVFFLILLIGCYVSMSVGQNFKQQKYNKSVRVLESFNDAEKILFGNIELLDSEISDITLSRHNSQELRILRNSIYAKYGYIFSSNDLTNYFSHFSWYKPERKNVDNLLNDIDKKNISKIKFFEDSYKGTIEVKSRLEGNWQNYPIMADDWSDTFVFSGDRFDFHYSKMNNFRLINGFSGKFYIKGMQLICEVSEVFFLNHISYSIDFFSDSESWEKANEIKCTLSSPIKLIFPITEIDYNFEVTNGLKRNKMRIGSIDYYQIEHAVYK